MKTYSYADLLGRELGRKKQEKRGFLDFIESILSSLTKTVSLQITVPTNIYIRTQLLCEYIEEEADVRFDIPNFLMLIYLDFIQTSIKKYQPMKIYQEIQKSYGYDDVLTIHANDKVYEYKRYQGTKTNLMITMDKKDARKGEMLLAELDDLYGQTISLEKMLSNLWIHFIEEYKRGDNMKAFNQIVRMLKKQI